MLNLFFVDFTKINDKSNEKFSIDNSKIRNSTSSIVDGSYVFDTDYLILYLYDLYHDEESSKFISIYGSQLHNRSSNNITILTYFDRIMVESWFNVYRRDLLITNVTNDFMLQSRECMNRLKSVYNLIKMPALVIIKKDKKGCEKSFIVYLEKTDAEEIYNTFTEIMNLIDEHCEEDFEIICNKINGTQFNQSKKFCYFNYSSFVDNLLKREGRNQNDVCDILGITDRTFRTKRDYGKFSREDCIYIALYLKCSIKELNNLLNGSNQNEIGFIKYEDIVIRECLSFRNKDRDSDELIAMYRFKLKEKEKLAE